MVRRIPLSGATVAALGLLAAGVFTVLAALIDMVRADDAFGSVGFGGELDFLDRVAIGMNRLDVRVALLLPLALVLVRPVLEQARDGSGTDRPTRWVVAGTAFLAGALLFLIALHLVAALTADGLSFTSTAAGFFDNLAALAVAAGAGLWAWRDLQIIGEGPPVAGSAPDPAPPMGWPPAPGAQSPPGAAPAPPPGAQAPAEGSQPRGDEQERRWGPPPV